MPLSPVQKAFATCRDPFPCFCGGFGSGKTAALVARAMALKAHFRTCDIAYYLPTYPLVEDIAFRRFPELCERKEWSYKINKASAYIEFPNAGRIVFRTMENPERIIGYEVAHSLLDELDTLKPEKARDVWNKVIARNRQKCSMANTVAVGTTPEGFGFVYDRWVKNKVPGYTLFRAKTSDNAANLPAGYIDNLRGTYPDNLLLAYLDGEFVNLTSGSVYTKYDRHLNGTHARIEQGEPLHIGMDFNVQNMAACVWVIRDNNIFAVDELTGIFDTPAMIQAIKNRYPDHSILVYPDASGRARKSNNASESDLSLLRDAKFSVMVNGSNPAVKDRVLATNRMIHINGERRLRVNVDRCPSLVEALEKQCYDKNGEPDKSTGLDHIIDAATYMVAYRFPIQSRNTQQTDMFL
jgi:hypothetical protein